MKSRANHYQSLRYIPLTEWKVVDVSLETRSPLVTLERRSGGQSGPMLVNKSAVLDSCLNTSCFSKPSLHPTLVKYANVCYIWCYKDTRHWITRPQYCAMLTLVLGVRGWRQWGPDH